MEVIALSFSVLLGYVHNAIAELIDPRQKSNALRYSLKDTVIVLGAFSAFFMQSESFLEYQRQLKSCCGRDNTQAYFNGYRYCRSSFRSGRLPSSYVRQKYTQQFVS
jgi:hypothetical protein